MGERCGVLHSGSESVFSRLPKSIDNILRRLHALESLHEHLKNQKGSLVHVTTIEMTEHCQNQRIEKESHDKITGWLKSKRVEFSICSCMLPYFRDQSSSADVP